MPFAVTLFSRNRSVKNKLFVAVRGEAVAYRHKRGIFAVVKFYMTVGAFSVEHFDCPILKSFVVNLKVEQLNTPAEFNGNVAVCICADFRKLEVHVKLKRRVARYEYYAVSYAESEFNIRI